jgi:hypothetical protein
MKAQDPHSSETLWAYLHGELDDAGRAAVEAELLRDPDVRGRCQDARSLDRLLRAVLPALGSGGEAAEALAEQALTAWERDSDASRKAGPAAPGDLPARSKTWLLFRRQSFLAVGLAAAAVLLLAVSSALLAPRGMRWAEPAYAPLVLRGTGVPEAGRGVHAENARRCQEALKAALERALARRRVTPPPGLVLSLRLQELKEGAFSVCLQARLRQGGTVGEWSGDYSGLAVFLDQAEASAARVAEAIVDFSGAGGGGNKP